VSTEASPGHEFAAVATLGLFVPAHNHSFQFCEALRREGPLHGLQPSLFEDGGGHVQPPPCS